MEVCLEGVTSKGNWGITYQLERLKHFGLKATFFVEPLHARVVGDRWLRRTVQAVEAAGQEVQLHLHPEWLVEISDPALPRASSRFMHEFDLRAQTNLIEAGLEMLRNVGATRLCAFRAGSFGANNDTLRAAARAGLAFDTSLNACYLDSYCRIDSHATLLQPSWIDGLIEFPISFFADYPGHRRHAQVCATSASELRNALMTAWRTSWYAFVILSHSFELIKNRDRGARFARPAPINIRRFDALCTFLAEHRDKFVTAHFHDLDPTRVPLELPARVITSSLPRTVWRMAEQVLARL
jgi:hypothetical protein